MRLEGKTLCSLALLILWDSPLAAQPDSLSVGLNLYSSAFFDNKEFSGGIKKGYTIPGFFVQPTLRVDAPRYNVGAGFHLLYLAGTDSLEHLVPVLRLTYSVSPTFSMTVGTINPEENHCLPEPLFKTERFYLNQPELGVQLRVDRLRYKGDLWVNWERYIKRGSPFQEEFTVGFVSRVKPGTFSTKEGFYATAMALATHRGGQIDNSGLSVVTLVNLGGTLGHRVALANGNMLLGVECSGYVSADRSPNPQSKYQNGNALHPKLALVWPSLLVEVGYWKSIYFVNPRGEELFGSLSTVSPQLDEDRRSIITSTLAFNRRVGREFNVAIGLNAYVDLANGLTEYSYFFRLVFDGTVFRQP